MKKILISLLMMFMLVPCINAEEVNTPNETETIISTNETEEQNEEITQAEEKIETEIELEKFIEKIAPNNVVTMTVPKSFTKYYKYLNPANEINSAEDYEEVFSYFAYNYIKNYEYNIENKMSAYLNNISEDLSKTTLNITYFENGNYNGNKQIDVSLKWAEEDPKGLELVKPYAEKLSTQKLHFTTTDLSLIKYLQNENIKTMDILDILDLMIAENISTSKSTSNDGIVYRIKSSECGGVGFSFGCGGTFAIGYNGTYYLPIKNISSGVFYHIYIPDETENTVEAYIEAAKARIDNYFGANDIKIEKSMTLSEYFGEDMDEYWEEVIGTYTISQTGEYIYKVTINGKEYDFLIIKDSNKIEKPIHLTEDVKTGATITTTSSEVPTDATINVQAIEKTSEVFKNIVEKVKAKVDEAMVLDFKLFSKSKNDYITKLSNGEFIVSVPIIDVLKGKDLIAYYITDEGKIEKHPVTVKDGVATFTTNHFSIYTIAEDNGIKVPNTYDGIMNFVIMGIIGIVGLGIFFTLKPHKN